MHNLLYKRWKQSTQAARIVLEDPRALEKILRYDRHYRKEVVERYGYADGLPVVDLLDLIPGFSETLDPISFLSDGSTPTDYALLKALAKRYDRCRYLEIGTWRGESIANVSPVAEECYSVSLSREDLLKYGFSEQMVDTLYFFSEKLPNAVHIGADSLTFDFSSLQKKFDLIFIDGDHNKDSILSDTRNAFQLLRDERSVIVWHDYGHTPERIRWETLSAILEGCPPAYREHLYHVSNTLCAIYLRGPQRTRTLTYPEIPDKVFTLTLSARKVEGPP